MLNGTKILTFFKLLFVMKGSLITLKQL